MNSRLFFALCVALFGLFATQALAADTCLGMPFTTKETSCAGLIPCLLGTYCDKTAACVPTKALAAACENSYECGTGAMCRGPENAMVCVAINGPGQACTGDSAVAQADCFNNLACNDTSKTCYYGKYNDGCTSNLDCATQKCTNGACDGSVGVDCQIGSGDQCSPANFCDLDTSKCIARLAVGAACTFDQCVSTAVCIRASPQQSSNNRTCVAKASLAPGTFSDNEETACASGLSSNNYCVTGSPAYCTNDGQQCGTGEMCLCGGSYLTTGYGKCGSYNCISKYQDMSTCLKTQCGSADVSTIAYSNSCFNRNCKTQFDAAVACNSALASIFLGGGNNPAK